MSLKDCVNRAVAGGEMDKARADQIVSEYDNSFQELRQHMGHTQAEAEAARSVVAQAKRDAFEKRRVTQLQAAAVGEQMRRMSEYKTVRGAPNPNGYLMDVVSTKHGAGGSTLHGRFNAIKSDFRGRFTDGVNAFRTLPGGIRREKALLDDVGRALFGEKVESARAKHIAATFQDIAETARTRFNSAGGHIGKRSDWGLPQNHDARTVRKAGYERWRSSILYRNGRDATDGLKLNLARMGEDFNDGRPFTEASIEVQLKDAFEAIRTDGQSRLKPGGRAGSSAMYKKRADHRFFAFNTYDDWKAYSHEFGAGQDAFRVMTGHMDNMALDISMMEELGPNPNHTFAFLKDAAMNMAQKSDVLDAPNKVRQAQNTAQNMYDLLQGKTDIPHNLFWAQTGSAVRNYVSSSLLGRAIISSVSDINTARMAANFVGVGQLEPAKMMARIYKNPNMRNELAEAGMILENGVEIGNAVARYELEDMQFEGAARLADATIRTTGLGWLTEARKQAFGASVMHTIASDWRNHAFGDLKPRSQRTLKGYGITEADWETIRRAEVHTMEKGLTIVRAQEVEKVGGQALADRYLEAIQSMQDFAVPSTELRGRATLLGGTKRGTPAGEVVRFGMQFKGYSVTLMMTHAMRVVREAQAGRPQTALTYAAGMIIGNTMLGGVAMQMKDIAKGKDPRDATTANFWGAAFMQGGGIGIFGDFLFADHNRFGGGFAETVAGPGVGFISDTAKLTVGNIMDLGNDAGKDAVSWLRRWTPGGSNWYWSLAYEREVLDQLQQLADPAASRSFRSRERSARKSGTEFFFPPGSSLVTGEGQVRPPEFGNALGE